MNKICTTIEQSKKLLEIGIDVNTADMSYSSIHNIGQEVSYCNVPLCIRPMCDDIPAWSLTALLGLIPTLGYRNPQLVKNIFDNNWRCLYDSTAVDSIIFTQDHDEPVDAAFDMILKLKEKGLL